MSLTTNIDRSGDVFTAQAAFRAIMDATARPGRPFAIAGIESAPAPLSAAMGTIAKTLFDQDTPVWLDASLRTPTVAQWLRFETQCPIVDDPAAAVFALIGDPMAMPVFETFNLGTAEYPDRSTTLVISVLDFNSGEPIVLRGPGIRDRETLRATPLPHDIAQRIVSNRGLFPRGVDLMLVAGGELIAVPRSVRIEGA